MIDEKKLYSISQAAELIGVSADTLRRWEEEGLYKPVRTSGGQRRYEVSTLKKLRPLTRRFRGRKNLPTKDEVQLLTPRPIYLNRKYLTFSLALAVWILAFGIAFGQTSVGKKFFGETGSIIKSLFNSEEAMRRIAKEEIGWEQNKKLGKILGDEESAPSSYSLLPTAYSPNLLKNPSFETAGSAPSAFWTFHPASVDANTSMSNSASNSGAYSLMIHNPNCVNGETLNCVFGVTQESTKTGEGKSITLSLAAKFVPDPAIPKALSPKIHLALGPGYDKSFSFTQSQELSNDWRLFSASFSSPPPNLVPRFYVSAYTGGFVYFDDASMAESDSLANLPDSIGGPNLPDQLASMFGSSTINYQSLIIPGGGTLSVTPQGILYPTDSSQTQGGLGTDSNRFGKAWLSNVDLSQSLSVNEKIDIAGKLTANGNITLGNNDGDEIEVGGRFISDLLPKQSNAVSIGTSTQRWNNLFAAAGNISNNLAIGGNTTMTGSLTISGGMTLSGGSGLSVTGDLALDGDLDFQGPQNITTTADNLTISPTGNLIIDTSGGTVYIRDAAIDIAGQNTTISASNLTVSATGTINRTAAGDISDRVTGDNDYILRAGDAAAESTANNNDIFIAAEDSIVMKSSSFSQTTSGNTETIVSAGDYSVLVQGNNDLYLRGGGAGRNDATDGGDLQLAAQDSMILDAGDIAITASEDAAYPLIIKSSAGGIQLSTQSSDNGNLTLYSAGSLTLDSSRNNTNILLLPGSGRIGIGTTSPLTTFHINTTDGIIIPVGTTAQRAGTPTTGTIRYNNTTSQFEGYGSTAWGSLGGVIDVDQNTYVSAEDSPGANNDDLKFITAGTQRMMIDETGNIGIGPGPGSAVPAGLFDIVGNAPIILRAGQSALNNSTSGSTSTTADIQLSAADQILLNSGTLSLISSNDSSYPLLLRSSQGGIQLSSQSRDNGGILISSAGNLYIDTSFYGTTTFIQGGLVRVGDSGTNTTATGADDLYVEGDFEVDGNVSLGASSASTLSVGSYVTSNLVPDPGSTYDLGSNTRKWLNLYADTVTANNISGTVITGSTSAANWTIDVSNATADLEDSTVTFERGTEVTNSEIRWNSSGDRFFSTNASFQISPDTGVGAPVRPEQAILTVNDSYGGRRIATFSEQGTPRAVIDSGGNILLYQGSNIETSAGTLTMKGYSGLTLTTSSATTGEIRVLSRGTLQLDTSTNNDNILLRAGTGNINLSATQARLTGNLIVTGTETFNGVAYTFPGADGSASNALTTNGAGLLSWGTLGAASITADSLDFAQFQDELDLDADTSINGDYSLIVRAGLGAIQNSTSGSNDLQLSAEDKLILAGASFDLSTSNGAVDIISNQRLDLSSGGTLTLDTSSNNSNILLKTGSGNINVSTGTLTMTGVLDVRNSTGTLALATDSNGNVGVGTNAPTGILDILGQCVTGDTVLKRRRRRRRRGKNGDPASAEGFGEAQWEDVRIDEIEAGDEILTLDENSGRFVVQKVNKLMDKGIQTVFELVTESGKRVEATKEHPYLTVEANKKAPVSQSSFDSSFPFGEIRTYQKTVYQTYQKLSSPLFKEWTGGELDPRNWNDKSCLPTRVRPTNSFYQTLSWRKISLLKPGMLIATIDGWERIVAIKNTGRKQVYDIEVEGTHNFVGNGIVAHNTTGILMRAGASSLQLSSSATSTTADIELAAADRIDLFAGSLSLQTSSQTAGELKLMSKGSLILDTSANNTNIRLSAGTGNVQVSSTQLYLTGNLVVTGTETFNGVAYTFPGADGSASNVLTTSGAGLLSWGTLGAASITNDSLDFAQFDDSLDLDADTSINGPQSFIVRAGNAARQNATSGNNDLQLSAEDALIVDAGDIAITASEDSTYPLIFRSSAGGIQLSTQSSDNGNLTLYSAGTLTLDTSRNNTNVLILPGTGNVGIGSTAPVYKLDVNGTLRTTSTARIEGALTVTTGGASVTGDLTLDGDLDFTGAQNITTTSDDLTLSPTGNLIIDTSGGTLSIRDAGIDLTNQPTTISGSSLTLRSTGNFILDTSASNTNLVLQGGTGGLTGSFGTANLTAVTDSVSAIYLNSQRGGITLSSSNASGSGPVKILSGGSLQLSTSQGNQPIYLQAGTGNLNVSSNQLYLTGNLVVTGTETFNGVTYTFPGADGSASNVLTTSGAGLLSWGTLGAASITADSLDFTEFKDTLTMDSDTAVNGDYSLIVRAGLGSIQNSTSGSNDLQLSAEDKLILAGASFDLSTSNGAVDIISNQRLDLSSGGTLTLDTSQNNANIVLTPGTGNIGIGSTAPIYKLDVNGTLRTTSTARIEGALTITTGGASVTGDLTLDGDLDFTGAQNITTTADNLTLSPTGNLIIDTSGGTLSIRDAAIDLTNQPTTLSASSLTLRSTGNFILDTSANNTNLVLQGGTGGLTGSFGTANLTAINDSVSAVYLNSQRGGITLSSSNASGNGPVKILSGGSLQLSTSQGNQPILLQAGTGNVNVSSNQLYLTGNLVVTGTETLNGIAYTFPGADTANGVLISNGSGILSWNTIGQSNVTNDSLDFAQFQDELDLDADTSINGDYSLIVRAGLGSIQNSTSGSNDLQFSAEDKLIFDAASLTLTTSNGPIDILSRGYLDLSSTGTLTLDTSQNNTNILLKAGTGSINLSSGTTTISGNVNLNSGTLTLNGLAYTFPGSQSANNVLLTNGSGVLSWTTLGGSSITNDSLDFAQFDDSLDLDADTSINGPQSFIVRAGNAARQNATSGNNDLQLSAEDQILIHGSSMLLETSSVSAGQLVIRSDGTLQLDTSANNTNVLVNIGSGNMNIDAGTLFVAGGNDRVGIGTTSPSTLLHVRGAVTGQTLVNFDEIGDQDILTASKSGTPRLTVTRDGNIKFNQTSTIYTIAGDLQLQTSSGRNDNIVVRTYDSAASTVNGDDIFIAAQDNLYLGASALTLETTSGSAGQLVIRSDGTLQLDTSANNTNILLKAGTGSINLSSGTTTISGNVNLNSGTLTLNGQTYTFPGTAGSNTYALTTNGSGVLSWSQAAGAFTDSGTYVYPTNSTRKFIYGYEGQQTATGYFETIGNDAVILRAGQAAINPSVSGSTSTTADIQIAAADRLDLYATSYSLTTSGNSVDILSGGRIDLSAKGNLTLDTSQNNANILLLPGTGNVGIGTSTPLSTLDVLGSAAGILMRAGASSLQLSSGTTSTTADIQLAAADRIDLFAGSLSLQTSSTTAGDLKIISKGSLILDTSSSLGGSAPIILQGGNVGIGTTGPKGILDIKGTSPVSIIGRPTTDVGNESVTFAGACTTCTDLQGGMRLTRNATTSTWDMGLGGSIFSSTSNFNTVTILGSGNVGIGTTGPAFKFDVIDSGIGNATMRLGSTGAQSTTLRIDTYNDAGQTANNRNWAFRNRYTNYGLLELMRSVDSTSDPLTTVMSWDKSGNVGIGTAGPLQLLHVKRSTDGPPVRFEDSNGYCEIDPTTTTWTCTSDLRLKKDITPLSSDLALEGLTKLQGVNFRWLGQADDSNLRLGFVAQEVEKVFPELVRTDENGLKSVAYGGFTPYLVEAIKGLNLKIENLTDSGGSSQISQTREMDTTPIREIEASQSAAVADIDLLKTRVSSLEDLVNLLTLSTSSGANVPLGSSGSELISPLPETKLTLDASTDTVHILGDTAIGGNLTVGLLTINDMDASINSMGETLKLQSLGLADIEFMGGKIVIDTQGNLKVEGRIEAQTVAAEEFKVLGTKSTGGAVLRAGTLTLSVSTEAVTPESRVLITPTSKTEAVIAVTEKVFGRFTVEIALPQPEDISFDWFIIGN